MDFATSHFGKMNLWPVEHFFKIFVLTFGWVCWVQYQTHPKVRSNILKKCSTGQRLPFRNDPLQNPYFKVEIPSVTQDSFIALKILLSLFPLIFLEIRLDQFWILSDLYIHFLTFKTRELCLLVVYFKWQKF